MEEPRALPPFRGPVLQAHVRDGRIVLDQPAELPEGATVLVFVVGSARGGGPREWSAEFLAALGAWDDGEIPRPGS